MVEEYNVLNVFCKFAVNIMLNYKKCIIMRKRKSLYAVFIVTFALTACSSEFENQQTNEPLENISGERLGMHLMESFNNPISRSSDVRNRVYPDYYGGAYLKQDGNLVVNVKNEDKEIVNDLKNRCKGDDFDTQIVEYSYNDIMSIAYQLDEYLSTDKKGAAALQFNGFCVNDVENCIDIYLGEISQAGIDAFKKNVIDSPILNFEKNNPMEFQSGTIYPGQSMYYVSWGSVGFRAKRYGTEGFVTAGHVAKMEGFEVFGSSTAIEAIGITQISQTSGDMDAAFCSVTNGYSPSNRLNNDFVSLSPTLASCLVGTRVYLNARHNNSSGYISSSYASVTVNSEMSLYGMIQADYTSQAGDSGGVVYTDGLSIAGTHVGSNSIYAYFQPASRTVERYGLELY